MKKLITVLAFVFCAVVLTSCTAESTQLEEQIAIENELQSRIHPSEEFGIDEEDHREE